MLLGSRSNQSRLSECEIGVSRVEKPAELRTGGFRSANETLILNV